MYPVEVYLACAELPGLAAGVYHFDPRGPALTCLREGDHRAHLVRAAAYEPAVARAPVVLVLTGIPWRTGWKYTERGYRHLFWDAGMIVANLLALATSAGFPTRVVLGFADAGVDSLLALEPRREFALVLVPVGAGDEEVAPADGPPKVASFEFAPLSRTEYVYQGIFQANETGRLGVAEDVRLWREGWTAGEPTSGNSVPPAEVRDSLEEVIRRRGSARVFGAGSLPAATLADVLARAATPIPTDYAVNGGHLIKPYLVVNDVRGLEPGAYVFRGGELRLLRAAGFRREAGFLCLEQRLGATAAATHFLMADLGHVLGELGARGYRAAQLEAGIVAGRIYLCAYAHHFGATVSPSTTTRSRASSLPTRKARVACWSWPSATAPASAAAGNPTRPGRQRVEGTHTACRSDEAAAPCENAEGIVQQGLTP